MKPVKSKSLSAKSVLNRLIMAAEKENVIYRILKDSNKTYLAHVSGYSRNSFSKKIKARSFSFSELIRIFKIIQNMPEEESKKSRIDWNSVYVVNDRKENAAVLRVRKTCGGKKQGIVPSVQKEGPAKENL